MCGEGGVDPCVRMVVVDSMSVCSRGADRRDDKHSNRGNTPPQHTMDSDESDGFDDPVGAPAMSFRLSLSLSLSVCLCVYLSLCLCICVSICLCVYVSVRLSVYSSVCPSV
jgi:hypothetical protein